MAGRLATVDTKHMRGTPGHRLVSCIGKLVHLCFLKDKEERIYDYTSGTYFDLQTKELDLYIRD